MTLGEGTTLGAYRIVRKIGEGGMGAVYRAEHVLLGRAAAIKVLLPAPSSQREVVDRFFNEARATTAVNDPGIVSVFDFGFHTDGSAYIVMELLDGESLAARVARGTISVVDALRIARQTAGSLAAAHARGIVHRDLKPENLMMVRDPEAQGGERPKILDFGIAKLTGDPADRTRTRTGMLLGTPVYMSPEQCRGSGATDHRSDIYSLGCVLYHLLTGHPPFDLEGVGEIISAHLRELARPPSALVPGLPPAVDDLVLRCLAKEPVERFQTMTEVQAACEAQLARITGAGAQTIALPAGVRLQPTTLGTASGEALPRRLGKPLAWAAAVALVAIAGAIALVVQGHRATPVGDARVERAPAIDAGVRPDAMPDAAPPDAAPDAAIPAVVPPPHHVDRPRPHVPIKTPKAPTTEDPYDSR